MPRRKFDGSKPVFPKNLIFRKLHLFFVLTLLHIISTTRYFHKIFSLRMAKESDQERNLDSGKSISNSNIEKPNAMDYNNGTTESPTSCMNT